MVNKSLMQKKKKIPSPRTKMNFMQLMAKTERVWDKAKSRLEVKHY